MIYYDRIDVSEGIDVNNTNKSNECDICHYCYFLNNGLKFQPNVSNRCYDYDLVKMSMNLSDNAVLNFKSALIVNFRMTQCRKQLFVGVLQNWCS